nr:hypothetical protein [Tanacetum cinerariifolium]
MRNRLKPDMTREGVNGGDGSSVNGVVEQVVDKIEILALPNDSSDVTAQPKFMTLTSRLPNFRKKMEDLRIGA